MHLSIVAERLLLFAVMSFLAIHIVSCMWLWQALLMEESNPDYPSWLSINHGDPYEDYCTYAAFSQYIASLYFTQIVIFGNLHAFNTTERMMSMALFVLGGFFMTMSISVLSQIFATMD
jgi:hypothetical protein